MKLHSIDTKLLSKSKSNTYTKLKVCLNYSTKASTTTTTTTTEASIDEDYIPAPVNTQPISGGPCKHEGEYKPHPYECTKYYQCVYGEFLEHDCGVGLHWQDRGNLCNWPAQAKCKERVPPSDELITKKPITTTTTTTAYEEEFTTRRTTRKPISTIRPTTPEPVFYKPPSSESCDNGVYKPNVNDCESYFVCVNHQWVRHDCGYGFHFDQTQLQCDYASKVRCVLASRYLKLVGKLSRIQEDDPCEGGDYVAYPGKCEEYLFCLHGAMYAGSCAPGLHWNAQANICDWPESANCKEEGNPVLTETGTNEIGGYIPITTTSAPVTTKRPKPVTPRPPVKPFSGDYKLVCYFTKCVFIRWLLFTSLIEPRHKL